MESSSPEYFIGHRNNNILLQELIQGLESVNQLTRLLAADHDKPSVLAHLALKISESFTESISLVKRSRPIGEVSDKIPVNNSMGNSPPQVPKSEDSEGSCKSTSVLKQRRGCYKRRKSTQTLTKIGPNLVDDGHAWRKYGQKPIHNATHPRNYYRCTHKFDQGCQATKQVQKTDEDPPMYKITYDGNHCCKHPLKAPPHIILDSCIIPTHTSTSNSHIISFGSTHYPNTKLNHEPYYPTSFPSVKQEYSLHQHDQLNPSLNHNQSTSTPHPLFQLPDSMVLDSSGLVPALSQVSDHGDMISSSGAYSCTSSTHDDCFDDLDTLVAVGDFDVSQFEFCKY